MAQLTRGARQILDALDDAEAEIRDLLQRASDKAKSNPDYTRELIARVLDIQAKTARKRTEDLEPLLERQAPEYERRLRELDERVRALEEVATLSLPRHRRVETPE